MCRIEMFVKTHLIYILLVFPLICQSLRYGCPDKAITGCYCTSNWVNNEYRIVVTCNGLNGKVDDIKENLQKLNGYEFDEMIINNYGTNRLPDEAFDDILIRKITINNSPKLEGFGAKNSGKTFFENLGNGLETLLVFNSPKIKDTEWEGLTKSLASGVTDTITTPATGTTIGSATTSSPAATPGAKSRSLFAKTTKATKAIGPVLKNLIVYRNTDFTLRDATKFEGLDSLEKIIFRSNGLTEFSIDLDKFPKLRFLDLSENKVKTFETTGNSSQLKTVYLNKNLIETFSEDTLKFISELDFIDVRNNKLSCSCDDVETLVDAKVTSKIKGTCASPAALVNKPYGEDCMKSNEYRIGGKGF